MTQRRTTDDAAAEKAGPEPARAEPAQLAQSEERFRLLVESVSDYAIFMLDPERPHRDLEPGRRAHQGLPRRRDHRPALLDLLSAGGAGPRPARARARRPRRGTAASRTRAGACARTAPASGPTSSSPRCATPPARCLGFAKVTRDLTERRRPRKRCARARSASACWSRASATTPSSCSIPAATSRRWNAGAERIKGYRAERDHRPALLALLPARGHRARACRSTSWRSRAREGRFEDEGWRLRKDGTRFWANVVITALRDAHGELRGFAKVTRDLTERRRVETLEDEGRQTTEFLAMLGHELRNPLAPIRNAVEIIRAREGTDPTVAWARDLIDRQVSHLSRLVDDLLDVSRITSGKITLQKEPPRPGRCSSSRAVESTRSAAGGTEPHALPDPAQRAAARRRRRHPPLPGRAQPAQQRGQVHAGRRADLGQPGDATAARPSCRCATTASAWRPTCSRACSTCSPRASARSTARKAASGSASRSCAARRHARRLGARRPARAPAQGSEFVVRLPALARAVPEATPGREPADPPHRRGAACWSSTTTPTPRSRWRRCSRSGATTSTSPSDGPAALALAADRRPEVVLLDIGLPGMTGYEVAQRLARDPGHGRRRAHRHDRVRPGRGPPEVARSGVRPAPREARLAGRAPKDLRGSRARGGRGRALSWWRQRGSVVLTPQSQKRGVSLGVSADKRRRLLPCLEARRKNC